MPLLIILLLILSFGALLKINRTSRRIARLEAAVARLTDLQASQGAAAAPPDMVPPDIAPAGLAPAGLAPAGLAPAGLAPAGVAPARMQSAIALAAAPLLADDAHFAPAPPRAAPGGAEQEARRSLESMIGNRWGLWLGGAVLLIAAGYFVREAVAHGWMGPVARVLVLFGVAGIFIGLGRSPLLDKITGTLNVGWSHLRPVLNATGIGFLYAGAFAAGPHYGLVGAAPFLAGMTAISIFALYSSISYGMPVAVIGILGGYLLPLLGGYGGEGIGKLGALVYLAALFVTADMSGRAANRASLQMLAAAAATLDGAVLFYYTPATALLWLLMILYVMARAARRGGGEAVVSVAILLLLLLAGALLAPDRLIWRSCFAVVTPVAIAMAWRHPRLWNLAPLAGLADLAFLAVWHGEGTPLVTTALALGIGFALPLFKSRRTDAWLSLHAAMVLGVTTLVYLKMARLPPPPGHQLSLWSGLFAALAIGFYLTSLNGAGRFLPGRTAAGKLVQTVTAFVFGLAAISYLALPHEIANSLIAFTIVVIATSGEDDRFYRYLRPAIFMLVAICRMLDLRALDADLATLPVTAILLHGFMPVALLGSLSLILRGRRHTAIGQRLEDADIFSLGAGLSLLVSFLWTIDWGAARGLFGADLVFWAPIAFMLEALATFLSLLLCDWRFPQRPSVSSAILRWGYGGAAGGMMLVLVFLNPFFLDHGITAAPALVLVMQYVVPIAAVGGALWWYRTRTSGPRAATIKKLAIVYLQSAGFVLLSTATYLVCNGQADPLVFVSSEIWALSAVWTLYGAGLIAFGLLTRETLWRSGGLLIMGVTACKVLLVDTGNLSGMARVGSLFGLGIVLIAVGLLYQRYTRDVEST